MAAHPSREEAEGIAVAALGFIAGDEKLLPRFLSLTGIEASAIRHAARQAGFLAGVLEFICAHEPTLLEFASAAGLKPERIAAARTALPGGNNAYEVSA